MVFGFILGLDSAKYFESLLSENLSWQEKEKLIRLTSNRGLNLKAYWNDNAA